MRQGFSVYLWLSWDLLCRTSWSQTHLWAPDTHTQYTSIYASSPTHKLKTKLKRQIFLEASWLWLLPWEFTLPVLLKSTVVKETQSQKQNKNKTKLNQTSKQTNQPPNPLSSSGACFKQQTLLLPLNTSIAAAITGYWVCTQGRGRAGTRDHPENKGILSGLWRDPNHSSYLSLPGPRSPLTLRPIRIAVFLGHKWDFQQQAKEANLPQNFQHCRIKSSFQKLPYLLISTSTPLASWLLPRYPFSTSSPFSPLLSYGNLQW